MVHGAAGPAFRANLRDQLVKKSGFVVPNFHE
jgi:hypothetical protein